MPLRTRILVIIVLPVVFYPLLIIYFNKYQDILIRSEFEAIERQGLTFVKTIGMLDEEYQLIEKNKIYSNYLQALLPFDYKNYKLQARLYNLKGVLIADSSKGIYTSEVKIKKLPEVEKKFDLENYFNKSVRYLSKLVSQPIDLTVYKYTSSNNFKIIPPEVKESLKRLKMSREEKRRIENTVDFLNLLSSGPKSEKWTNEELRRLIDLNQLSVETSINIIQASNSNIKDFLSSLEILRSTEDLISFEPLLTAQELMDLLNIEPGPLVGEILSWLKEIHLRDGTISIDEEKKMVLDHWKK